MTNSLFSPNDTLVYQLGWTLIHTLWQGALSALVLGVILRSLREHSSEARYIAALLCLILLACAPFVTYSRLSISASSSTFAPVRQTRSQTPAGADRSLGPTLVEQLVPMASLNRSIQPSAPLQETTTAPITGIKEQAVKWLTPLLPLYVLLWFSGVLILSIHHLAGWVIVQRLRKRYVEPPSEQILRLAEQLQTTLRIRTAVALMKSALTDSPVTIGWLKPVILLPASALTGLTTKQIEALLAHELAHIRRHDYLVNLLQTVVETLLFYHPAVWWISRQIRIEREHCCDDIAVRVCGDPASYARALAEMEQLRDTAPFAMAAKNSSLLNRVRRLASHQHANARDAWNGWWISVPTLLLLTGLMMLQMLPVAQSKTRKETPKDESQWTGKLRNGIEVELLGISSHPSTPDSWWRPDGSPLSTAPYTDDSSHLSLQENERAYEFAVQLRNLPVEYVSTRMETIPNGSSAGGCNDADQPVLPHTRDFIAWVPKNVRDCILRVGVAGDKWQTAFDYTRNGKLWPSSSHNTEKFQFAFAPPLESQNRTVFTLTHSLTSVDQRVVAIDKEGKLHQSIRSDNQSVGPLVQTTATFEMRLDDIDHFEIQERPFEWVEFKSIPLKEIPPGSLAETIPEKFKRKTNPRYFLSIPLFETRVPTPEEEALLSRILDRHRRIGDVRIGLTRSTFSLNTRQDGPKARMMGGFVKIENESRLYLPETGHTVGKVVGDMSDQKASFIRMGGQWWADVSQLMGMPGTTQTAFDGNRVWFRFTDKVEIIPATKVNTFNINLAAPMGLKIQEGEARENMIYLGEEDYNGPCHVFAKQSPGCSGPETWNIYHYYFDKDNLLLKKIEFFFWVNLDEGPSLIFSLDDYTLEESLSDVEPALFRPPTDGITETKEVTFPGPGELVVGLSDGSNGSLQASYRLKYEGGSWGSGLN